VTRHQWLITAATGSIAETWLPTRIAPPGATSSEPVGWIAQRSRSARIAVIVAQ